MSVPSPPRASSISAFVTITLMANCTGQWLPWNSVSLNYAYCRCSARIFPSLHTRTKKCVTMASVCVRLRRILFLGRRRQSQSVSLCVWANAKLMQIQSNRVIWLNLSHVCITMGRRGALIGEGAHDYRRRRVHPQRPSRRASAYV